MKRLLYIIPFILLLASCSAQKKIVEVPIETIKTEYIHDIRVDSVFVKDSIDRYVKGDTVFIYKEHTKFKYLNKTDTICKTDTIPKIVEVPVEVEKKVEVKVNHMHWWQEAFMWIGVASALMLAGFTFYKIKLK